MAEDAIWHIGTKWWALGCGINGNLAVEVASRKIHGDKSWQMQLGKRISLTAPTLIYYTTISAVTHHSLNRDRENSGNNSLWCLMKTMKHWPFICWISFLWNIKIDLNFISFLHIQINVALSRDRSPWTTWRQRSVHCAHPMAWLFVDLWPLLLTWFNLNPSMDN